MRSIEKPEDIVEAASRIVFVAVPLFVGIIGALAILCLQAYIYLQDGVWPEISVVAPAFIRGSMRYLSPRVVGYPEDSDACTAVSCVSHWSGAKLSSLDR